jgi:tetratricopeptide (TPR) repeat protein
MKAAAVLVIGLVAVAAAARGEDGAPVKAARAHFQKGEAAFASGRLEDALASYQAAFEAKPLPGFLFNIAQCHRKLGHHQQALEFYRRYLTLDPQTGNRATVEGLIAEEESRLSLAPPVLAQSAPTAAAPAVGSPSVIAPPVAVLTPLPPRAVVAPAVAAPSGPVAPRTRPRWWLWAAVGTAVVGGTVAAVALAGGQHGQTAGLGVIDWR